MICTIHWEMDQDMVPKYIALIKNVVDVVHGFVLYVLSVKNCSFDGPMETYEVRRFLHLQRFLCLP